MFVYFLQIINIQVVGRRVVDIWWEYTTQWWTLTCIWMWQVQYGWFCDCLRADGTSGVPWCTTGECMFYHVYHLIQSMVRRVFVGNHGCSFSVRWWSISHEQYAHTAINVYSITCHCFQFIGPLGMYSHFICVYLNDFKSWYLEHLFWYRS